MAVRLWRDRLLKEPLTKDLVIAEKSNLIFSSIKDVKSTSEIRECSANTQAEIVLTPDGERRVRNGGIIPTAIIDALRQPHRTTYIIRMNDDRKTFTVEFFKANSN